MAASHGREMQADLRRRIYFFLCNSSKVYLYPRPSMVHKLSLCCKGFALPETRQHGNIRAAAETLGTACGKSRGAVGRKDGLWWGSLGSSWGSAQSPAAPHLPASAPSQCESSGVLLVPLIEPASYVCFED